MSQSVDFQNVGAMPGTEGLAARIWQRDPGVWSQDPTVQRAIAQRLGWLDAVEFTRQRMADIDEFVESARADQLVHAVLLGMGGSSLAPEVLARCFGSAPGYLELTVLDSTAPDQVRWVAASVPLARTLFIVSSKSGTTAETQALYDYFHDQLQRAGIPHSGERFVAITDAGSLLETLGRERGFRRVFCNPADIGGRYSALSYFGVVPGALTGAPIGRLLDSAQGEIETTRSSPSSPALRIGTAIAALAERGRDKLTLVLSPQMRPLGAWIEQLVDESTGKDGKGIVVIDGESAADGSEYGNDRVFVGVASTADNERAALDRLSAYAADGHPVIRWTVPDLNGLGAEFFRWEFATAVAGAVLAVNPFDEPDVNESKATTIALLKGDTQVGGVTAPEVLRCSGDEATGGDVATQLAQFLREVRPGDYLALLAYLPSEPAVEQPLLRMREEARRALGVATCFAYGPRYLHSSGQLHKGGANRGVFLVVSADPDRDLAIPGRDYGFQRLVQSQAAGDLQVLLRRGRRAIHVHLGAPLPASLANFEALWAEVLATLGT